MRPRRCGDTVTASRPGPSVSRRTSWRVPVGRLDDRAYPLPADTLLTGQPVTLPSGRITGEIWILRPGPGFGSVTRCACARARRCPALPGLVGVATAEQRSDPITSSACSRKAIDYNISSKRNTKHTAAIRSNRGTNRKRKRTKSCFKNCQMSRECACFWASTSMLLCPRPSSSTS